MADDGGGRCEGDTFGPWAVHALADAGTDLSMPDAEGFTALHHAAT